jgi:DHA1 family bicyclomycin/chloramphenicol resistance-like MFS transporter
VGLSIYIVTAVGCSLSPSIEWLITLRLLMALGACVGIVVSRAVVRDLFPVNEIAGVFSTFMLIIAVSPMLAPSIGGYVTKNLGWQVIFFILAGFSALLLLVTIRWLPESKKPDESVSLRPVKMFRQYAEVARDRQFLAYAIIGGLGSAGLFAYISGSSFVFMELFGLSQTQFGWVFALNAGGLIVGSQVNRLLLRRHTSAQIVSFFVRAQVLIGAVLVAVFLVGIAKVGVVVPLLIVFLFCTGVSNPNTAALALEPFTANAGSASALLGSIQMAVGALATAIVSSLANGTALPMVLTIWGSAVAGLLALSLARRGVEDRARQTVT